MRPVRSFRWLRNALIPVVLLTVPFEVARVLVEEPGRAGSYNRFAVVTPFDLPLLVLGILTVPAVPAALRRSRRLGVWTATGLALLGALGLLTAMSGLGLERVVRLAGSLLLVIAVSELEPAGFRRLVAAPLLAAAGIQGLIGLAQVASGGPIGLDVLGERTDLVGFGPVTGAAGTTIHPYVLAGLSLLAVAAGLVVLTGDARPTGRSRVWWIAALVPAAVPLGTTFSRAGLLAAMAAAIGIGWGWRRHPERWRAPALAVAAAVLIPGLVWVGGWTGRTLNPEREGLDRISSGRVTQLREWGRLIADHWGVGVGTGRYTVVLERDYAPESPDAVHDIPLLVAGEAGIGAGLVVLALLAGLGVQSVRAGPAGVVVYAALISFVLLDKYPYVHPNGLVLLAVWLALADRAADQNEAP